jgi:hypothetical protein
MGFGTSSANICARPPRLPAVAELCEQAAVANCTYKTGLVASYPQYMQGTARVQGYPPALWALAYTGSGRVVAW